MVHTWATFPSPWMCWPVERSTDTQPFSHRDYGIDMLIPGHFWQIGWIALEPKFRLLDVIMESQRWNLR